jgi:ribosomal protein S18 acetylase RimI-like enzyme
VAPEIRRPKLSDIPELVRLARILNQSEGDPTEHMDAHAFEYALFREPAPISCLIAAESEWLTGLILFHRSWHMPHAEYGLYVSDLIVDPCQQGKSIGRMLMAATAAEAKNLGLTFLWWTAKPSNATAISFYAGIGATRDLVLAHALVGDPFNELANEGQTNP